MAYDKGRSERRNLAPVIGSDKSLCSRAQRQPQILSAPTTLPLFLGHWDPARATSCQFDAAPGARRDARIRAELSPCQKNVRPRLHERCRLPRCRCFHQMRFISRGLREHVQRNSGVRGHQSRLHSSGFAIFLPDLRETSHFFYLSPLLNVAYTIHARKH